MRFSKKFSRRARGFFFTIHLWTGLWLGLWLTLIGLTGSLLAWMPELTTSEVKFKYPLDSSPLTSAPIPLSQALNAIKTANPDMSAKEFSSVQMPTGRYPYYVMFRRIKDEVAVVLTDPHSGRVHPTFLFKDLWMGKVNLFHTALLAGIPGLLGNGVLSFFALLLLGSGLWLWWPSTIRQLKTRTTLKRKSSWGRWLRDIHNILGVYLYAILFVTTLTAVLLVANHATRGGVEKVVDKSVGSTEKPVLVVARGQKISVDKLVENAVAAVPDAALDGVRFPQKPDAPFQTRHLRGSGFLSSTIVSLDPYSGRVLQIEHDRTASLGHKTMGVIQDLHFGYFGGIWSKLLYTVAGFIPLGLFLTGTAIWWRKRTKKSVAISADFADVDDARTSASVL